MLEIVLIFSAVVLTIVGLALLGRKAFTAWWLYRGKRIVTCPETGKPAGVEVDALRAAAAATFGGGPELVPKDCTRWPLREACGQGCLSEIEETPSQCLVRTRLDRWYAGMTCVLCRKLIGEIGWIWKPALLSPDRKPVSWGDVAIEDIPGVLATHERICAGCYAAESLRVRYPALASDEPRPTDRPGAPLA
jgi:hypothetical protein